MGPVFAQEAVTCYQASVPVTDVYLSYQGGLDDLKEAMGGRVQSLYPDGDENALDLPFSYLAGDPGGEQFEALIAQAAQEGLSEFSYHIVYGVDEGSWAWTEEALALWDQGLIQAEPAEYDLTVHLRPEDLQVTYRPDPALPVPTQWGDRGDPFHWLYLPDYDTLVQTESPYDPAELDVEIQWDEQSYLDGMASGAVEFTLIGSYTGLYNNSPGAPLYDLYDRGLLQIEGTPQTLIRVQDMAPSLYYNPYFPQFQVYRNRFQFDIYAAPGTGFDDVQLPSEGILDLVDGEPQDARAFGLIWSREDYEAGLASGADRFTITGAYGPNPAWPEEDLALWDSGDIAILGDDSPDTPAPQLTVHILRDELPFSVAMEFRMQDEGEGLIPVFTFPWPNGAEKVTPAFSLDKIIWYEQDVTWREEFEWQMAEEHFLHVDEAGRLVAIPQDVPAAFYCKLTVTGSSFAGETAVMVVSPDENGNWTMSEDQGGDHGGGGQGQHDRPGKEEPDDLPEVPADPSTAPDQAPNPPAGSGGHTGPRPVPRPEPPPELEPELRPTPTPTPAWSPTPAPEAPPPSPAPDSIPDQVPPGPAPLEDLAALEVWPLPEGGAGAPPSKGGESGGGRTEPSPEPSPEPSREAAPPSGAITGENAPAAPEDRVPSPAPEPTPQAVEPSASALSTPAAPHHIPGFAAAGAATAAVLLIGGLWTHWRGRRK